ncbi:unnamed protein product [Durusdinium trenchii]|uniref:Uncharacterized protein n=1 Tax=Durusdinium trenchii TaxID=1381693 RepID=A0ABP0I0E5_9DINO
MVEALMDEEPPASAAEQTQLGLDNLRLPQDEESPGTAMIEEEIPVEEPAEEAQEIGSRNDPISGRDRKRSFSCTSSVTSFQASSASSIRAGMPIRAAPREGGEAQKEERRGHIENSRLRVRPLAERLEAHVEVAMRRAKEQWQQQQIEAEERRKVSFIIRLQAMQRGRFARQRVQKLQCQSAAAELLQVLLRSNMAQRQLFEGLAAATKIQATRRGQVEREQVRVQKEEMIRAATRVQANFRGNRERERANIEQLARKEAATKIQAIKRGNDGRQQAEAERKAKLKAITKMQAVYRGQVTRKLLAKEKQECSETACMQEEEARADHS